MNVLSLFDGIACGRVALQRANIKADSYYASEIDESAIKIAKYQFPDIVEIGNVCNVSYDGKTGRLFTEKGIFSVRTIDLIMGGSPCTDFSSVGYAKGMKSGNIEILTLEQYLDFKENGYQFDGQSYLFWEYVRILREVKPKYFLLENVKMSKKWQTVITNALGVNPILINSALISAQNRPRLYWTNIQDISVPQDKGIVLEDILDINASIDDVSHCLTVQRAFPRLLKKYGYIPQKFNAFNATEIKDKACALSRGSMVTSSCATLLFVKAINGKHLVRNGVLDGIYPTKLEDGRYNLRRLSFVEMECLQTLPDKYTDVVGVGNQKQSAVLGNGWTVDVIVHILSFLN